MANYKPYDLVIVPFPFTDLATGKRRPALVLSSEEYLENTGQIICAMVTTAKRSSWKSDLSIKDWSEAGLPVPSTIRMKIFTLDERFVIKPLGQLTQSDAARVQKQLKKVLP